MRLLPLVLLLAGRPAAAAGASDFFPPETKVVIGIQVRHALELVGTLPGDLVVKNPIAGFDPLKDLDEVFIATSGKGDSPPALMVLRGRFDVAKIGREPKPIDAGMMGAGTGVMAFVDAT